MIPPKEKAEQLVKAMYKWTFDDRDNPEDPNLEAIKCAVIAVDEIRAFIDDQMQGFLDSDWLSYWQQVKQEIEKI